MELDYFLHKIQGVLKNEERCLGTLDSIKKESEKDISRIVASLKKAIEFEEVSDKANQKLYILLCLNTNTELYSVLKKHKKYAHLVGFFPKLSHDIFMKIVVGLQLQHYLYISISHFCSSLSYQVLEICLNALNWLELFEAVEFAENILAHLFKKLISVDETDQFNTHLKDAFQRLLLFYDPEKGGTVKRMRLWDKPKLKHYAGLVLASLLSLLEKCTRIYYKKEKDNSTNDYNIFKIQIDQETVTENCTIAIENAFITTKQCYEHVLDKCLENVCEVNIDMWLFWVEIDLDDIPDTENTLQRYIGEKAYICRETLKEAECLISSKGTSDLISKLKTMATKPHDEYETNSLDLVQVLKNIQDSNKDTRKWLIFLLNNSSFVVEPSSLEVLKNYITYLQTTDIVKLSNILFSFIKSNENHEVHKKCFLEIVKCLDIDSLMEVSKAFVENFGLSEIFMTEDYQYVFVEIFNKVINEEEKEKELYPQFMNLALQNAKSVVSRAVAEGITSEVRGHLMADILGKLQAFCDAPKDDNPLLIAVLGELLLTLPSLPESHRTNYSLFVRELVMRKNLDGEEFIKRCLLVKLELYLKAKNWPVLIAALETLSELYDVDCIYNCPVSIFMLLQVVQANRWNPTTYHADAVHVCVIALQLIKQLISKWFDIGFEDRELKNLTDLVHQCISPLNRYHLFRLISEERTSTDPALQLIYRMHYGIGEWSILQVTPEERIKLVYSLCYVLPVLTSNEWNDLFCVVAPKCSEFLCLFHIVADSITLCLDSSKINIDPTVISCLAATLINVAESVEYEMKRWNENDNEYRISVLRTLCQLVSNFPLREQLTMGMTIIKILVQLLPEGSRRKPLTDDEINSVTVSIASIQADSVRHNLANEFLDMIHR